MYPYFSAISLLAILLFYFMVTFNVSRARKKYGIKAPATTGNEQFERVFRVQMNTLEQMVLFLPCMSLASWYVSDILSALIGIIWLVSRIFYARSYYRGSEKKNIWYVIGVICTGLLWLGGAWAIFFHFFLKVMVH